MNLFWGESRVPGGLPRQATRPSWVGGMQHLGCLPEPGTIDGLACIDWAEAIS